MTRSGTPAALQEDDVPAEEKQRRLADLLERQRRISHEENQKWVGRSIEILVEGRDSRRGQWICRTGQNKTLLLPAEPAMTVGTFHTAKVLRAEGQSLGAGLGRAAGARELDPRVPARDGAARW